MFLLYHTFNLIETHKRKGVPIIPYLKNGLKETYTGSDDITYGYLYDANNQLTGVQVPNLGFITINEYSWNRPASMTLPGGTTKNFSYDPLMRIKQIETKDPGENVLLNYQYNYDKMDNITSRDTEHGAYGYDYDDLYRLKTVDNPVQDDEAFTYDLVGNRLTAAETDGGWTYNDNNELVTSAPSSSGSTGEATFDYDANGNMIQKTVDGVVTSYVYNIEDRLTQIWNGEAGTGSLTAEYYYDPFGRRLWKEVSGVRTYFHYADEGLVAEIDAVGTETKTYGYKPGSTWTTDPLFMKVGTEYYFYHNDHLGTPQKITAVNGTIVWDAKYSSFGEATVEVADVENNLRFPGQYYDGESGLHYNWKRYYDPKAGRYLRKDPAGLMKGTNHLYIYAKNNTLIYLDAYGLKCTLIDSVTKHKFERKEDVVYGDWVYSPWKEWQRANSLCWCIWHRDKRIDVTETTTSVTYKALECKEKDKCGKEIKKYKFKTETKISVKEESEYGGREERKDFGTMTGTGDGLESGNHCDCEPIVEPNPPGLYQD